ncbi:MAG: helix-turn-helix transcriptional regulator [Ruminococcaceae bacterium]|nr:helix-turn-helix transcriptional regulator [Oscillospiraceae bacterium]
MDIGMRLRQARLEMGLSQRQLCGDVITRNMLSQIENGTARPSMDTLVYLAARLNRPVAYFLDGEISSPNAVCMEKARNLFTQGKLIEADAALQEYRAPDGFFDEEWGLLKTLVLLGRAEEEMDRPGYALELLEQAARQKSCYLTKETERRRLLLLAQVSREPVELPSEDLSLRLRAKAALQAGDGVRCRALLEACEEKECAAWRHLRAEAAFRMGDFALAAEYYPEHCYQRLEECYRNLGDYKMAYEYACKQRQASSNSPKDDV